MKHQASRNSNHKRYSEEAWSNMGKEEMLKIRQGLSFEHVSDFLEGTGYKVAYSLATGNPKDIYVVFFKDENVIILKNKETLIKENNELRKGD